jgi:hypothetical protein
VLTMGYFTFKDLLYDRWRSGLTIISLTVVMVGYLLMASLAQAIAGVSSQARVTNNLLILEANIIDPMDSSQDESVLGTTLEIAPDQIQRTFPLLFRHLTIEGHILQVRAVPEEEMPVSLGLTLIQGSWPDGPRQVVASEAAARLASWEVGSSVNIYGTHFQVNGLVRTAENAFGSLWMTYTEGQELFGTAHGFQVGYLVLKPSADRESVRQRLLADPRISSGHSVYLENVFTDDYNQSNKNLLMLSGLMVLISLLAITFGNYNAASLSLTERSQEIGLLRLIGFTSSRLRAFLFARSLALTLVAYGLGWGISLIFINGQRSRSSISLVFQSLHLNPLSSLAGLGLAILFAFLGVWLTSRRLAALNPLMGNE